MGNVVDEADFDTAVLVPVAAVFDGNDGTTAAFADIDQPFRGDA